MKIIEIKDVKSNSAVLLIFTGILIVSALSNIDSLLNKLILLLSKLFEFSFYSTGLIAAFSFQILIVLGLFYLIIISVKDKNSNEVPFFVFQSKHFKIVWIICLILFLINIIVSLFSMDLYSKKISDYMIGNLHNFETSKVYLYLFAETLSYIKAALFMILFLILVVKDKK